MGEAVSSLGGVCMSPRGMSVCSAFCTMGSSVQFKGLFSSCEGLHSTSFRELITIGGRRSSL